MPVEQRGRVIAVEHGPTGLNREEPENFSGRRQPSSDGTSRMMREYQVRFCEGLGVKFPVAAGKAANLEGGRPLPSIARFRTASISDARGGNEPRCART